MILTIEKKNTTEFYHKREFQSSAFNLDTNIDDTQKGSVAK
jgi:hypothetical protein